VCVTRKCYDGGGFGHGGGGGSVELVVIPTLKDLMVVVTENKSD
jgi:hypothetical protein